jgi:16S rRNA (uracil1498-N3)-methyltransferase
MSSAAKIRLFVEHPLGQGQTLPLSREQAHYLFAVMRLAVGDPVLVFDGQSGEWLAHVAEAGKRGGILLCDRQTRPLLPPPDLWLLFAPIKKARTDFIVEKATEMGAARICPVQTAHTNAERIRRDRLQAHAVEAAEQCGGTVVPVVDDLRRLADLLGDWPADRRLMFCDEALAGEGGGLPATVAAEPGSDAPPPGRAGARPAAGPWAILIGPEGGFSDAERSRLAALPQACAVALGPRILRADTAAVAALTLWQSRLGDWT